MSIEVLRRSDNTGLQFNDSVHPLIQKIYKQRTISDADELELGLNNLLTPDKLMGIGDAVEPVSYTHLTLPTNREV